MVPSSKSAEECVGCGVGGGVGGCGVGGVGAGVAFFNLSRKRPIPFISDFLLVVVVVVVVVVSGW